MSDANGSAGAGNPAGDGAAGAGAAAAPWYGATAPDEIKGFVQTKGWDTPDKAIQSYKNLESLLGQDKAGKALYMPKDDADAEGWSKVFDRLGRPADPKGYELPKPDGDDGKFAEAMAPKLHEAGLTKTQAQKIAQAFNEFSAARNAELDAKAKADTEAQEAELKRELGPRFDAERDRGRAAAKAFGVDESMLDSIEASMGYAKTMKLFAAIGAKIGEDSFNAGEGTSGGMSPSAGKVRLQQLSDDKAFARRLMDGDAAAMKEWADANSAANRV